MTQLGLQATHSTCPYLAFLCVMFLSSRPWICYWILHSMALLGEFIDADLEDRTIEFLSRCQVLGPI